MCSILPVCGALTKLVYMAFLLLSNWFKFSNFIGCKFAFSPPVIEQFSALSLSFFHTHHWDCCCHLVACKCYYRRNNFSGPTKCKDKLVYLTVSEEKDTCDIDSELEQHLNSATRPEVCIEQSVKTFTDCSRDPESGKAGLGFMWHI